MKIAARLRMQIISPISVIFIRAAVRSCNPKMSVFTYFHDTPVMRRQSNLFLNGNPITSRFMHDFIELII